MLIHILLIISIYAIVALINWKLPKQREKLRKFIYGFGFFLTFMSIHVRINFYQISTIELLTLISIFVPLSFLATEYIQWLKNKDDTKYTQKTLNTAVWFLIVLSIANLILLSWACDHYENTHICDSDYSRFASEFGVVCPKRHIRGKR